MKGRFKFWIGFILLISSVGYYYYPVIGNIVLKVLKLVYIVINVVGILASLFLEDLRIDLYNWTPKEMLDHENNIQIIFYFLHPWLLIILLIKYINLWSDKHL